MLVLAVLAATGCRGLDTLGLPNGGASPPSSIPHQGGTELPGDTAPAPPVPADRNMADGAVAVPPAADVAMRTDVGAAPPDAAPTLAADGSAAHDRVVSSPDAATEQPSGAGPPPLSTGLVAHWRLDEGAGTTAADSSGNGNTGTLLNGTSWTSGGVKGARFPNPAALSLDGTNDRVELRSRTLATLGKPRSVSLWFLYNSSGPGGSRLRDLVALANPGAGAAIQIGFEDGQAAVWTWGPRSMIRSGFSTPSGWHHLAYTFDGSVHRLYVDATAVGNATRAIPDVAVTHAILGDFAPSGFSEQFNGLIDDVRIYGRVLDAKEIASLAAGE